MMSDTDKSTFVEEVRAWLAENNEIVDAKFTAIRRSTLGAAPMAASVEIRFAPEMVQP